MRALRHGFDRSDQLAVLWGGLLTVVVVVGTAEANVKLAVGPFLVIAALGLLVAGWLLVPQVVVAITIPLFALLPTLKVFISAWLGPVKDFVTLAAAIALLITIVTRSRRAEVSHIDRLLAWLIIAFGALYVINVGGLIAGGSHGIAWIQGIRLNGEPLILLAAGLTVRNPQRTFHAAIVSLIATGVGVAIYGIYQQMVGPAGLLPLGYSYEHQLRMIGGHLRSFGTVDDPFLYAAFLLLAVTAALFWMRPGPLKVACLSVLIVGVTFSYVRSAIPIAIALLALWLVRNRRVTLGFLMLAASVAVGLTFLVALSGASETHSVRAGPNTYVTLNGRTTVWATIFSRPTKVPFGLGVAKVGTAAERAQSGVLFKPDAATKTVIAVDSGYFATVADVGIVGLVVVLALFSRILALGAASARRGDVTGWLVIGWMIVLLIDAMTRASFTGFPTAFLGMLVIGVGLARSMRGSPSRRVGTR